MDTFVRVEVRGGLNKKLAGEAIDNAISRMKKLAASPRTLPGPATQKVLKESEQLKKLTNGAFDVKFEGGGKINLGGIAKGFIVDEGIKVLKEHGVKRALINAGGDMYCMGEYKIGIRDPKDRRSVIATLSVCDKGIATSAAYERGTHIIDPRTGRPVEKKFKSVTVIAETCMRADGLATALYVLEPREGLSVIEGIDDTECFIIDETGATYVSSEFPRTHLTK
ncbi:MAG: FAD:protein FMN transferase [Candidatus Omnitrophota bacterium]